MGRVIGGRRGAGPLVVAPGRDFLGTLLFAGVGREGRLRSGERGPMVRFWGAIVLSFPPHTPHTHPSASVFKPAATKKGWGRLVDLGGERERRGSRREGHHGKKQSAVLPRGLSLSHSHAGSGSKGQRAQAQRCQHETVGRGRGRARREFWRRREKENRDCRDTRAEFFVVVCFWGEQRSLVQPPVSVCYRLGGWGAFSFLWACARKNAAGVVRARVRGGRGAGTPHTHTHTHTAQSHARVSLTARVCGVRRCETKQGGGEGN